WIPSSRREIWDERGRRHMTTLLAVEGLTKSFGGIRALDECSFEIAEGSVGALIGPNGSGKTTAFNVITGFQPADAGRLTFRGRLVRHPDPCRLQRLGLARSFQQARIFSGLSVLENVVLGRNQSWRALLGRRVSGPERRRAEDLLDEPAAGITPIMVKTMEDHIRRRHAQGVTFLIVEHEMKFVMRLCDPVIVLDRGRPIACAAPDVVQNDPRVLDAYLGD